MKKLLAYSIVALIIASAFLLYALENRHPTGLASRENPMFQISLSIPREYKIISDGNQVLSYLEIKRIGNEGRVDISLEYEIISPNKNVILRKVETVAVETENSFVRYLELPDEAEIGLYTISAKLIYNGQKEATTEATFLVY